jgi:hypothetical protein
MAQKQIIPLAGQTQKANREQLPARGQQLKDAETGNSQGPVMQMGITRKPHYAGLAAKLQPKIGRH